MSSEPATNAVEVREPTPFDVLTTFQRLYVKNRLDGLAPRPAYRAAGGAESGVSSQPYILEQHPKIIAAKKWAIGGNESEEIDRDAVLKGLMDAVSSAATSAELTMAWREIGKLVGVYAAERSELIINDLTTERLKTYSDRELAGLVEKGQAAPAATSTFIEAQFEVLRDALEDPEEVTRDDG